VFLLVKYLVNQDVKIGYDPQQSAVGNAAGESAARKNQNEVCKPHYRDSAGIVVAGAVNKYQVHRIGVLGTESRTAPGFNLDYRWPTSGERHRCSQRGGAGATMSGRPSPDGQTQKGTDQRKVERMSPKRFSALTSGKTARKMRSEG